VTLIAANAFGSDTETKSALVHVLAPPAALTLSALEDTHVRELSPDSNYGSLTSLRVRDDPSSDYHAYLKFFVPEIGREVATAKLRLWVEDGGPDGGAVHAVASTWNESLLDWNHAPELAASFGAFGAVANGTWVGLDVPPALVQEGLVAFGLANANSNSVFYSSREGSHPPELSLTLTTPAPPMADFEADRRSGPPPLAVQFFDRSSGAPTNFLWDFGDGSSSTLENPSHSYQRPGRYAVTLTVTSTLGSDEELKLDYVTVLPFVKRAGPP
jgi:PKD repeat protein